MISVQQTETSRRVLNTFADSIQSNSRCCVEACATDAFIFHEELRMESELFGSTLKIAHQILKRVRGCLRREFRNPLFGSLRFVLIISTRAAVFRARASCLILLLINPLYRPTPMGPCPPPRPAPSSLARPASAYPQSLSPPSSSPTFPSRLLLLPRPTPERWGELEGAGLVSTPRSPPRLRRPGRGRIVGRFYSAAAGTTGAVRTPNWPPKAPQFSALPLVAVLSMRVGTSTSSSVPCPVW